MKKTFSISLGGLKFNIEEDAYNYLQKYFDDIKSHYSSSEEGKEILFDIESSIAEKLSDKIKSDNQVISMVEIEKIISVLGTASEIADEPTSNKEDKKEKDEKGSRRLYRNPDDSIIAGVCSGLAAYFDIDPVFIRLIFILLGLIEGIGFIIYFVMWLVVPVAKTSTQKLEMKGEPVNLSKIEEVVKEKSKMIGKESRAAVNKLKNSKSQIYKILNFPVKIIEVIFDFLKKIFKALGPALSIFIGVILIITSILTLFGLTIGIGAAAFYIDSPYIISDVSLTEFVGNVWYYIALASAYLIIAVPFIFMTVLSITMIKRRNSFRAGFSGILIAVWFVGIAGAVLSAGDLVPRIYEKANQISAEESVKRTYNYKDFEKLYISGNQDIEVIPGDEFSITLSGREEDLDRLDFNMEDGQLQITQSRRQFDNKICVLCFDKKIEGTIIIPELQSYVGIGNSEAEISGFTDDIYISIGERAEADIILEGQNIEASLAGAGSKLYLSGEAENLDISIIGYSKFYGTDLSVSKTNLNLGLYSKVQLDGATKDFEIKMKDYSKLDAYSFAAQNVIIETEDYANANIYVLDSLDAFSKNYSDVYYRGNPTELNIETMGHSQITK